MEGRKHGAFPGVAIYGLLLGLYPRAYLLRHRAELLQNFEDLEQALPSKAALWCLIAKDLAVSLWFECKRTFWAQTSIRFAILSLMLGIVHRHAGPREQLVWTFCFGYALGWFAGWFGWHWRMSSSSRSPIFVRSFRGQVVMLLGAIAVVLAAGTVFDDFQKRLIFASCYGVAIAWFTGWWVNYRHTCS